MLRILLLLAMSLSPTLAAGFTISLGGRLAIEPSADLRINYEAEPEAGLTLGINTRFRLRGVENPPDPTRPPWPGSLYRSGDVQASPFLQFTQRIQMDGWRLEPYQRLEATVGTYLFSQNPSGLYVTISPQIGAKFRFSLDRTSRLTNDINVGLDGWGIVPREQQPGENFRKALLVSNELRLDWNLGFIEPYLRGSIEFFPLLSSNNLVFGANVGANFNFASDLEGQLEVGYKTGDSPYLQARLTYRLP